MLWCHLYLNHSFKSSVLFCDLLCQCVFCDRTMTSQTLSMNPGHITVSYSRLAAYQELEEKANDMKRKRGNKALWLRHVFQHAATISCGHDAARSGVGVVIQIKMMPRVVWCCIAIGLFLLQGWSLSDRLIELCIIDATTMHWVHVFFFYDFSSHWCDKYCGLVLRYWKLWSIPDMVAAFVGWWWLL